MQSITKQFVAMAIAAALASVLLGTPAEDKKKATQSNQSAPLAKKPQQATTSRGANPVRDPRLASPVGKDAPLHTEPGRGGPYGRPVTHARQVGEEAKSVPGGRTEFRDPKSNRTVTTNARGEVRKIEAPVGLAGGKITINRGSHGEREIVTEHPGGLRVVGYGAHRGFVERPLRPGYVSRTYVDGEHSYPRVYRESRYRGVAYYHYVPAVYYGPAFYGWVSRPWVPVPYFWGSGITAPWLGFYASYFTPSSLYASPDWWLTDRVFAENLSFAYQNQEDASGAPPTSQPTGVGVDEAKPLIAQEVRQQIDDERRAADRPVPPATGPEQPPLALSQKFFVVSSNLDVIVAAQACMLTPGDVVQLQGKDLMSDGSIAVEVFSSKPGDCPAHFSGALPLAALQEMQNQMREQVDSGLKMLAENQAKGLPSGPPAVARPVAEGTADQDATAAAQLEAQQAVAGSVEAQVGGQR